MSMTSFNANDDNFSSLNNSRTDTSFHSFAKKRKKTLEDYEFVVDEATPNSELGKGSYGVVKKVKDKESGRIYAMKIMSKKTVYRHSTKENLKREIAIQKSASHPHIIRLYRCFEDSENVYVVLEFAKNGSLFHYLRKRKTLSEGEAFIYFFQTCLGIDYLHKKNIIHRDLKPENLLLDGEGNIKLCDFGWSVDKENYNKNVFCGTIDYMAPEMLKNLPHDHSLDIWSLGILLFELLHGKAPPRGKTDEEKMTNIKNNKPIEYSSGISALAKDLISKILKHEPQERISMMEIFDHPWMKQFEQTFGLDIMSYVNQQDEQLKQGRASRHSKTAILPILEKAEQEQDIENKNLETVKNDISENKVTNNENNKKDLAEVMNNIVITPLVVSNKGNTKAPEVDKNNRKSVDIESYLKEYKIDETDEMGLLNKIEMFAMGNDDYDLEHSPTFALNSRNGSYISQVRASQSVTPFDLNQRASTNNTLTRESGADQLINNPIDIRTSIYNDYENRIKNLYQDKGETAGNSLYNIDTEVRTHSHRSKSPSVKYNNANGANYIPINYKELLDEIKVNDPKRQSYLDVEDDRPERVSKVSRKSMMNIPIENPPRRKEKKPLGFFEKLLTTLGCISRENKETEDSR